MPWKLFPAELATEEGSARAATAQRALSKRREGSAKCDEDDSIGHDASVQDILLKMEEELRLRNVALLGRLAEMDKKLDRLNHVGGPPKPSLPRRVSFEDVLETRGPNNVAHGEHVQMAASMQMATSLPVEPKEATLGPLTPEPEARSAASRTPGSTCAGLPSHTSHPSPSIPRTILPTHSIGPPPIEHARRASAATWTRQFSPFADGGMFKREESCTDKMIQARIGKVEDKHSQARLKVLLFLEDTNSSLAALWFHRCMSLLTLVNVIVSLLQSQLAPQFKGASVVAFQIAFDAVCFVEVAVRFWVSPQSLSFFLDFFNWVDVLAGLVLLPRSVQLANSDTFWLEELLYTVVPVVWLLKLLRNFEQFHLLCSAFRIAFEALPVLLFTLAILVLSFACLIFHVEPRDNIDAPPRALWFTIVTMMTVGYGDITPSSSLGNVITSALMVGSQLYMAIPLGIVGSAFSSVWGRRDRLLLIRRTKMRLLRWGYSTEEILELMFFYDSHKMGSLDITDFKAMMFDMKLGLDDERVRKLFQELDVDGNGRITERELISALYPESNPYEVGLSVSNSASNPSEHALNG